MSRLRAWSAAVGGLLLLAYAVPLFVPPPATRPMPSEPGAGLFERLFPDVPAWWMVGRLICLLAGAALIARATRRPLPVRLDGRAGSARGARETSTPSVEMTRWVALLLASGLAVSAVYAARFSRFGETLYFLCLAAPAGVLAVAESKSPWRVVRLQGSQIVALLVMPAIWLAWSAPTALRSPRAASLVDMWSMVQRLGEVVSGQSKLFAESEVSGVTNSYLALDSLVILALGRPPLSFAQVQMVHFFWTAVCAVVVGVIVWRMVALGAAVVAQAVFLFAPLTMSFAYHPGPLYIMPLCVAVLLLLILCVRRYHSTAALAAFGTLAGFSGGIPQLSVVTALLCAFMGTSLSRLPQIPWIVVVVAALSCFAAIAPGLPNAEALATMVRETAFGKAQLAGVTMMLFGQQPPREYVMSAGRPELFDVPLGAVLAPFGVARTPLRLLGDTLLDPVGAVLMTTGLALCALHMIRNRAAVLLLGLLATGLATGLVASGDAVSHTRLAPAILPLAVLAGVGFEALRMAFARTLRPQGVAAVTAAMIAVAGIAIFDKVNSRILPASWLTISLEALSAHDASVDPIFLEHRGTFLHGGLIAALLPAQPVPSLQFFDFSRLRPKTTDTPGQVYLWSPGLERDGAVSCWICDRSPAAAVYTLTDQSGVSRAFAASPWGPIWHPGLPKERWTLSFCETPIDRDGATWLTPPRVDVPQCTGAGLSLQRPQ